MTGLVGQQLGRYRIVSFLGRGNFAEVYLGEHVHLGMQAAIKVSFGQLATEDQQKFREEARTIANLSHRHIIRVLDFGIEGTRPFIVMHYAPNGSLRKRHPKNSRLSLEIVMSYVKPIASALQYVHDHRIIHRDINPNNILIGENNEILLSDFGVATITHTASLTGPSDIAGTPEYMAPEQFVGPPLRASDQYALGIVVYEWLCGSLPFQGSFEELKRQHLSVLPPSLRTRIPTISPLVEQAILKALKKDPAQRFARVQAFANALEQAYRAESGPTISPPAVLVVVPDGGLVCPRCGYHNRPGAKFCKRDGQPLTPGATPVAAYQLGLQFFNSQDYVEAIKQFELARVRGNHSYEVLFNLGRAYREYGQLVRPKNKQLFTENIINAVEQFELATKAKPDSQEAYFQLGVCYHHLARFDQATVSFKKALQIGPKHAAIYYQLGMMAMAQDYLREAEAYFLEGLKINPDPALLREALGHLYRRMNLVDAAIKVLREATLRKPNRWEGWYEFGRAYVKAGEWILALDALEHALIGNPNSSRIYSAMAWCYLKMGRKSEAKLMVREALQRDPINAEANRLQDLLE